MAWLFLAQRNWLQAPHTSGKSTYVWRLLQLKTYKSNRAAVGAGGGSRTHKGFRPGMCEVPAFTNFATPAPFQSDDRGNPAKAWTRQLTRATVPRDEHNTETDASWYQIRATWIRLLRPASERETQPMTNPLSPIPYPLVAWCGGVQWCGND